MKARSLDTSIVMRWLLDDHPIQSKVARNLIESNKEYHIADMVITEMVHVFEFVKNLPRQLIAASVEALLDRANLNCNRALFREVLKNYVLHPKVSFVDCCLAQYAELNEATPLLTFDKKLANQIRNTELV